jgi:hypothetical protein
LIFQRAAALRRHTAKLSNPTLNAIRRDGFFPTKPLRKLHNSKSYFWIHPDGSKMQAVYFFPLEKSFRELLILKAFLSNSVRVFGAGPLGFNILRRDDPWDFELDLSNGTQINVEICSITDRNGFFQRLTAEELLERHSYYEEIRIGILKKILIAFPSSESNELLDQLRDEGRSNSESVKNPFFPPERRLFTSMTDLPLLDTEEQLRTEITKKHRKKHAEKSKTILIVDNRTATAALSDFERLAPKLRPLLDSVQFPEIWLYTGYGGGLKQCNEDYLLLPLKLPSANVEAYFENF